MFSPNSAAAKIAIALGLLGPVSSLTPLTYAARPSLDCGELLSKSSEFWAQVRDELEANLAHPHSLAEKYRIHPADLIQGPVIGSGGASVVTADTWRGLQVATKRYKRDVLGENDEKPESFFNTLAFQKTLGDLGIAPLLLGALWTTEGELAIVMERMVAIPSFRYHSKTPFIIRMIHKRGLRVQVEQIEKIMTSLNIYPSDIQGLVCSNGQIYLNDFDAYSLIDRAKSKDWIKIYTEMLLKSLERDCP